MRKKIPYFMVIFLMLFSPGCDRIEVENQISEKQQGIESLRTHNRQLTNEVKELASQVARLNAGQTDGIVIEELRKSLTLKESVLQGREERITKQETALRLAVVKIDKLQREFYAETGDKLEVIGEARQIKREYENMSAALGAANNRANNWLIYLSVLMVAFVAAIVYLIITAMRYSSQNRRVDNAMAYVEAGNLDNKDKQLIATYLDRKLDS